jgi:hypothetical protein
MRREAFGREATRQNSTSHTHAIDTKSRKLGHILFGRGQAQIKELEEGRGVCH